MFEFVMQLILAHTDHFLAVFLDRAYEVISLPPTNNSLLVTPLVPYATTNVDVTTWLYTLNVAGTPKLLLVLKRTLILDDYKKKTNSSIQSFKKTQIQSSNSND